MEEASRQPVRPFAALFGALRDLIAPSACLACDERVERHGALCIACWRSVRFIERPYCEVLGTPFPYDSGPGSLSAEAIADPPPFDRLRAAVLYDAVPRRLVSNLKFADRTDLAPWLAAWMRIAGTQLIADAGLVVPVPLHWTRLHARRYNQSAELARHVVRQRALFRPDVLIRQRRTDRQVGLDAAARRANIRGAFAVPPRLAAEVRGRRVLLVDDVYTTGATVSACAAALHRAGADAVDVLVFARVPVGDI